ncbi:MAG: hypothetical protein Q8K92_22870 [Leadbetterella sp.]|nr:hypothetical protein [Leadbetterella sp.]
MIDKCIFTPYVKNQNIAVDFRFLFYLPFPRLNNQKEADFAEKEIEITFTKFVKAKEARYKYLLSSQRDFSDAEFSFYHQTFLKERYIAISVDSNYFKYLTEIEFDEKYILSLLKACLLPESHTVKLLNAELKKMVDFEITQFPDAEYLNNWVRKILYYLNKSMEKIHYESIK